MPLTRIVMKRGRWESYRAAVVEQVYQALRDTFDVPENDLFATVSQHDDGDFVYGANYLGIERSDDLIILQITVSNTRTVEQKQALYRRLVERLGDEPGVRPEDVFVNLVEVTKENWSFGHGEAQYV